VAEPKIEPKRTRTAAVPLLALPLVVKIARKSTPSPRIQAKTVPIVTSSARARSPRLPMPIPATIVAAKRPMRMSIPKAAAASAPVNATWLSASLAKTCARRTRK
jgi:hypothetical protein